MPMIDVDKVTTDPSDLVAVQINNPQAREMIRQIHASQGLYNFRKHLNAHLQLHKDPKKRLEDFEKAWKDSMEINLQKQQARLFNDIETQFPSATPEEKWQMFVERYNTHVSQQASMLKMNFPDIFSKIEAVINRSIEETKKKALKESKKQLKEQEKLLKQKKKSLERESMDTDSDEEGDLSDLDELDDLDNKKKKRRRRKRH